MLKTQVILRRQKLKTKQPRRWACGKLDKTKADWRFVLATLGLVAFSFGSTEVWAASVKGEMSRVGDATHLEFSGLSQWSYDLKKVEANKFTLQMPAMDNATIAQLATWSDSLVSQVKVDKNGPDGSYVVTFTVADPKVESFDYLTDEPSRLILDFYRQTEAQAAPKKTAASGTGAAGAAAATKLPAKRKSAVAEKDSEGYQKKGSGQRRPAGDERLRVDNPAAGQQPAAEELGVKGGAFDAADPKFSRLQIKDYEIKDEAIIASKKNIYIHFPVLKMPVTLLPKLQANLPEFSIRPRDDRENKEARFLLDLYTRQIGKTDRTKDRIGSFFKVYEHFNMTYPESEYDEIVKNLAAHMYFLRWQMEKDPVDYQKSQDAYKYLLSRYPESPLAERIQQWIAYSELERGNGLDTIQEFQEYLRRHPNSEIKDQVQMGLAEGNLILNKYDEALKVYRDLQQNAVQPAARIEAHFREGDVFFARRDWPQAEKSYRSALAKYPQQISTYPNAYYNLAESLFWQRKYKESLDAYISFLSNYPDHAYGGYAMTRAGELLEAMGADRSRVVGAFLESYFRYRQNPGAEVARIRMLSQQMKGMKEKELKKAMEEMDEIARRSPLPTIGEFVVLMRTDGLQHRGENQEALKNLITYYQSNPTSTNLELFKSRILRNLSEVINRRVNDNDFMGTLQTQAQYSKTWLKNTDRLDIPYFAARAYEQAGAFDEARKIYDKILNKRQSIVGSEEEKERRVNEILPSVEALRLRMAAVAMQERQYPEAYQQLKSLVDTQKLSPSENNERVQLLAKVLRERGQLDPAKTYLRESIAAWKGEPAGIAPTLLDLAEIEMKSNNPEAAERAVDQVVGMRKNEIPVSDDMYAKALEIKGGALQAQKKDLAAVETYQQLLDDFESQRPLGSIRFRVGQILFERGDLASAEKIWLKLDAEKYGVFRKLAVERLENARWQSDHKKYIKRIPAMSNFKEDQ
ncbi:MAG: tetratricopeptide repeat protein [Bdellovibrionales bacterium]